MFHIELSTEEIRLIGTAPGVAYQAARWMKQFHRLSYSHIGWNDHADDMPVSDVLNKYGFLRVPRFELNAVRLLLETYGPLFIKGALSHLAQHETQLPVAEMTLFRVSSYQDADHAVILNGYWDGIKPSLLFRDPAHPQRQFLVEMSVLCERLDARAGILYLNCPTLSKPCPHVTAAGKVIRGKSTFSAKRKDPET
ncbi:MAG TPA: hypothetical protein VK419_17535 [Bryobacteraceae bacterium]|nr:hypothetical protein [Bryobacteraceae bacterium]